MPKCKYCDRSGWFLALTQIGLCSSCDPMIRLDTSQRGRILIDCLKLVEESKNLEVKISRYDLLIECAQALERYERHGIPTFDPPPSKILERYRGKKDKLILTFLSEELEKLSSKISFSGSPKIKVNYLLKMLLRIRDYKGKTDSPKSLDNLDQSVALQINTIKLEAFLDDAKKAEFKGQGKKALDEYYEALYFLKHDEIDDSLQNTNISFLEGKILKLGGKLDQYSKE